MPLPWRSCALRSIRWIRPFPFGPRWASRTGSSDQQELELARRWLKNFDSNSIPRQVGELSFSRSSGPGGQNTVGAPASRNPPNRVNSKATLKVPLVELFPLVPRLLHSPLRTSRFVSERSQTLVIQSDESRQQSINVDSCYTKLYQLLVRSAKEVIPGETSKEQKDRVHNLQRAQNEARLKDKKFHSSKKSNRRGNKYDD
ncbi:hypothetical protein N7462_002406 [Penicillium macrosclerotiorum]|uniref:uncharacterized protein n=1 Tax=Penicillium macrosclerotiorum TaxID=303699 RepID=UPI0025485F24|nr:uncharacterized protein N7462_002406 [Penicillium macrosclerotiorum]KAJ5692983.1 hypothetical protein N7462_002406 [Penicillium macrosclerotiorum]